MSYKILLLALLLTAGLRAFLQAPFYSEIKAFKQQDSLHFPAPGQIVFVGSSTFHYWQDVQSYFPDHPIINRGFGGSTLPDLIRYANDIILPYQPAQVVIYCGDNDLASSDALTPMVVLGRFEQLFYMIRQALPQATISFVSIKPSPSRQRLMPRMVETNNLVREFLTDKPHTSFIDIYPAMLDAQGRPIPEIFREDSLHMNEKGYRIWQKIMEPYLLVKQ